MQKKLICGKTGCWLFLTAFFSLPGLLVAQQAECDGCADTQAVFDAVTLIKEQGVALLETGETTAASFDLPSWSLTVPEVSIDGETLQLSMALEENPESQTGFAFRIVGSAAVEESDFPSALFDAVSGVMNIPLVDIQEGMQIVDQVSVSMSRDDSDDNLFIVDSAERHGQAVFRYETFGNEQLWTDQLRMHEVIESAVSPLTALEVGLKVDADVLPAGILESVDLNDPATTVALLEMGAVVGVKGRVENGRLTSLGITCALCHSDVDDSVMEGIGSRLDGYANRDLNPGAIIALSPTLAGTEAQEVYNSWGPGMYDARFNQDGINEPLLVPPIYGLQGVALETYTGDGPVSYWNAYVAITQMGGQGSFYDPRIDVFVNDPVDRVTASLPALYEYQMSLKAPEPLAGSFDSLAAERGQSLFEGKAACADCHSGSNFTDAASRLHSPESVGMEPVAAQRSATGLYRTTPLRALQFHAPYFHDGSAQSLDEVVEHYDQHFSLGLGTSEKRDLVEYLKSL